MAHGPKGCDASGETALKAMVVKEVDQFASVFDEAGLDIVAPPRRVVAVKVSRQDEAGGSFVFLGGVLNSASSLTTSRN